MQEVFHTRSGYLPAPRWAATLNAVNANEPRTVGAAGARHRRFALPCASDLTTDLLRIVADYQQAAGDMPADIRHHQARACLQLTAWLDWLELEGKRPRTLHNYERYVALLLRLYPDVPFHLFTGDMISRALRSVPPRSRYIPRSIYKGWFEWGELQGHIEPNQNPMRRVPKMKAGMRRPVSLFNQAEVDLLCGLPIIDGALFAILFGCLLRRDDACRLQRRHINLDTMLMTLYEGKGGRDDQIPFGPKVAAAVADLDLLIRLDPDDHLWYRGVLNKSRKQRIGKTTFDRWYRRCIDDAGVRYLKPHTTRHTGHWILKHVEGLDLEERRLVLRHKSIDTTTRQYPVVDVHDVVLKRAGVPHV